MQDRQSYGMIKLHTHDVQIFYGKYKSTLFTKEKSKKNCIFLNPAVFFVGIFIFLNSTKYLQPRVTRYS